MSTQLLARHADAPGQSLDMIASLPGTGIPVCDRIQTTVHASRFRSFLHCIESIRTVQSDPFKNLKSSFPWEGGHRQRRLPHESNQCLYATHIFGVALSF